MNFPTDNPTFYNVLQNERILNYNGDTIRSITDLLKLLFTVKYTILG